MGEADSTTNVGNFGLCLFNAYQNNNFKTFVEDSTEYYVEEDNTKVILTYYSNWIEITAIQKFFMETFRVTALSRSIQALWRINLVS